VSASKRSAAQGEVKASRKRGLCGQVGTFPALGLGAQSERGSDGKSHLLKLPRILPPWPRWQRPAAEHPREHSRAAFRKRAACALPILHGAQANPVASGKRGKVRLVAHGKAHPATVGGDAGERFPLLVRQSPGGDALTHATAKGEERGIVPTAEGRAHRAPAYHHPGPCPTLLPKPPAMIPLI
jgi:hypothetical protein